MINGPESRHSQDVEAQKEFPPPIQPHTVPNKARSPTSEEVSKIMRRMQAETKELADETLQKVRRNQRIGSSTKGMHPPRPPHLDKASVEVTLQEPLLEPPEAAI